MPLPKEIFVTNEHQEDDGGWYSVNLSPEDAVSSSEETTPEVGTYRLVDSAVMELIRTVKVKIRKTKKEQK